MAISSFIQTAIHKDLEGLRDYLARAWATGEIEVRLSELQLTGEGEVVTPDGVYGATAGFVGSLVRSHCRGEVEGYHFRSDQGVKKFFDDGGHRVLNRQLRQRDALVKVRTFGRTMAAVLSPSYRSITNLEIVKELMNMADLDLGWVAVSQHYFDLAVVMPDVLAVPKEGDPIRCGVFTCSSETGHSRLWVSPFLFRNLCANGTILSDFANPLAGVVLDQRHAGRGGESLVADFRAAAEEALGLAPQAASLVETW